MWYKMMQNAIYKKIKILLISGIGLWIAVFTQDLYSDTGRGGYSGNFLRMGLGARGMGMGGTSTALTTDGCTAYYNPAALVFLERKWITASLRSMALDRSLNYIGYAQSVGNTAEEASKKGLIRGGFSIGWLSAGVSNIDARDFNGNDIGTLSNWEHGFFFSFALNPAPQFAIGFSGKILYNRFPDITDKGEAISATGFGFDIGLLFRPSSNLFFGITVKDIRSGYTWDTQDLWERGTQTINSFPRILKMGGVWKGLQDRLVLALDIEKIEYWPFMYNGGAQWKVYDGIFLRGGLYHNDLTFGAGYDLALSNKSLRLDYAFVSDPVAPHGNHIFTCSFVF
jgi:hypothetical protein